MKNDAANYLSNETPLPTNFLWENRILNWFQVLMLIILKLNEGRVWKGFRTSRRSLRVVYEYKSIFIVTLIAKENIHREGKVVGIHFSLLLRQWVSEIEIAQTVLNEERVGETLFDSWKSEVKNFHLAFSKCYKLDYSDWTMCGGFWVSWNCWKSI